MVEIYDFNNCKLSFKNGSYGGLAGEKDGIIIDGCEWMLKYPKNLSQMKGEVASYSSSPLSEYLGSHIYELLGFNVHETRLGIKNDKLVVACKDFAVDKLLMEIRTVKNHTGANLSSYLEEKHVPSSESHVVDIDEILIHLNMNPVLLKVEGIKQRFFDQAIVDILINNNDRNNGNWGIIREKGKADILAPIFDNGGSFATKTTDAKMSRLMQSGGFEIDSTNVLTAYGKDGHFYTAAKFMNYVEKDICFQESMLRLFPMIIDKRDDIVSLFNSMPECHISKSGKRIEVMSSIRKEYYIKQLNIRIEKVLYPVYERIYSIKLNNNTPCVSDIRDKSKTI